MTARSLMLARAFLLAALLLLASDVHAAPSLRYSWDDCAPLVLDREFTGPAHYTQTLSVTGLTEPLTSFLVVIAAGDLDAWQFHDYGGCQGSSRLAATTAAAGCTSLPGLELTVSMFPGVTDHRLHLTVSGTVPAGPAPDPAARYVLARLDFDHSLTVTGYPAPSSYCGMGDYQQCFGIEYVTLNGSGVGYAYDNSMLTWNLPQSPGQCPFPVPTRATTWGRLKAIYR